MKKNLKVLMLSTISMQTLMGGFSETAADFHAKRAAFSAQMQLVATLVNQLSGQNSEVNSNQSGSNTNLIDQINAFKEAAAQLQAMKNTLGDQNSSLIATIQELNNLLDGVTGQSIVEKLRNYINQTNQYKSDTMDEIKKQDILIQELNNAKNQINKDLSNVTKQLNDANVLKDKLQEDIDKINMTVTSLESAKASLQAIIDEQKSTNAELDSTNKGLQDAIDNLTTQKNTLQTNLNAANASITDLTKQKTGLENQKSTLELEKEALEDNISTAITLIKAGEPNISAAVNAVNAVLGGTGETIHGRVTALGEVLGGTGSIHDQVTALVNNSDISTAIASIKANETVLTAAVTAVNTSLGGTGTTHARVTAAIASIKADATVLTAAVSAVNAALGGTGETIHDRVTVLEEVLGGTGSIHDQVTALVNNSDISTAIASIKADATVLTTAVTAVNTALGGADEATTHERATAAIASIKANETVLTAAVSAVNAVLGGADEATTHEQALAIQSYFGDGPILDDLSDVKIGLDETFSLPSGLKSLTVNSISESGGTITINTSDGDYVHDLPDGFSFASGDSIAFITGSSELAFHNKYGSTIDTQTALLNYLKSTYPNESTISERIPDMVSSLSMQVGTGAVSLRAKIAFIDKMIITNPTGVLAEDLDTLRGKITATLGATAEADVDAVNTALGGTAATTHARVTDAITSIKADETVLTAAVTAVNTALGGNGSSSTYQLLTNLAAFMFDGVLFLPSGVTQLEVKVAASLDGDKVSMTLTDGTTELKYKFMSSPFNIGNNSIFVMVNDENSKTVTFINKNNSSISNNDVLIDYLNSMYPVTSILTAPSMLLLQSIQTLRNQVGGTANALSSRIASLGRRLLTTPTGVLTEDLNTLRIKITDTQGATAEDDVATIADLLGTDGNTLKAQIGQPEATGASNLAEIIGGSGPLADRLGNPVTGTTGISGKIKNNTSVANNHIYSNEQTDFNDAGNITDQLHAFLAIFNTRSFVIQQGEYTSLAHLLNALESNA